MPDSRDLFTASSSAINVIAGNPGLTFTAAQLQGISTGTLVLRPAKLDGGCITHLRYQKGDDDLQQVSFDDGTFVNNVDVTNLNDFRKMFQEAANHGHGVTFCVDTEAKVMFMLNIYPCRCPCDDEQREG